MTGLKVADQGCHDFEAIVTGVCVGCSTSGSRKLAQAGTNTVVTSGNAVANSGNNNFVGAAQQALNDPNNAQNANLAAKQVISRIPEWRSRHQLLRTHMSRSCSRLLRVSSACRDFACRQKKHTRAKLRCLKRCKKLCLAPAVGDISNWQPASELKRPELANPGRAAYTGKAPATPLLHLTHVLSSVQ